jgi:nucleoside-diphosphate-sugar epimerase
MAEGIVLVTGATGFIGSAVIARLAKSYRVIALDRAGPPEPIMPAEAVDFDLSTDEGVAAALKTVRERYGERIASVIHLAAYYDITGEPNPLYEKITVQGARRLIDGLQSFQVEQFVSPAPCSFIARRTVQTRKSMRTRRLDPVGPIRNRRSAPKRCCTSAMAPSRW